MVRGRSIQGHRTFSPERMGRLKRPNRSMTKTSACPTILNDETRRMTSAPAKSPMKSMGEVSGVAG